MAKKQQTLEELVDSRIARVAEREPDWEALGFQADIDPRYKRAQMRYIGTGATGAEDANVIPAEHFTLSTMVLPEGAEGPLHLHSDSEEVFFVLDGQLKFIVEHEGERVERTLGPRDCISVPPGVYRGLVNVGEGEARMLVIIGSQKPELPTYPEDSPVKRK